MTSPQMKQLLENRIRELELEYELTNSELELVRRHRNLCFWAAILGLSVVLALVVLGRL